MDYLIPCQSFVSIPHMVDIQDLDNVPQMLVGCDDLHLRQLFDHLLYCALGLQQSLEHWQYTKLHPIYGHHDICVTDSRHTTSDLTHLLRPANTGIAPVPNQEAADVNGEEMECCSYICSHNFRHYSQHHQKSLEIVFGCYYLGYRTCTLRKHQHGHAGSRTHACRDSMCPTGLLGCIAVCAEAKVPVDGTATKSGK